MSTQKNVSLRAPAAEEPAARVRGFLAASGFLAKAVIAIGAAVILGYLAGNSALKSIIPGLVAMNPATAALFAAGGASLLLFQGDARSRAAGNGLASAIAAAGLLKLIGYIISQDVYFDHLFFPGQVDHDASGFANRIAPNTAFCFLLMGSALRLLYRDGKERLAQLLAFATFFLSLVAVLGYLYGSRELYGVAEYVPMALNTAAAFMAFSLAASFARPDRGLMALVSGEGVAGSLLRRMLPTFIAVPAALGYLRIIAVRAGVIPGDLAVAVFVVAIIVIISVCSWMLGGRLETVDAERLEAVKRLREEKTGVEYLLSSIGDGVVAIDRDWKIIAWNPAAARLTGWAADEAVGKSLRETVRFIRESDRTENVLFISDVMLSGKTRIMDNHTLLVRKDGSEVPVADSAAPVYDAAGKVTGAIIVFRNATAERDSRLVKSSFAYASHQLRTPVSAALWSLQAALEEKDPGKMRSGIEGAIHAMANVQKLTRQLVEVSDIDNGTVVVKLEPCDAAKAVKEALAAVREAAEERGISGAVDVPSGLKVAASPGLLARALHEILYNAVLYGKQGGSVRVAAARSGRGGVLFEVKDDGIGIPENQQSVIFTKFFRGQNVPPESVGAGLGLYIAQSYFRLLKGKVWFSSSEGEGTTFFIELPAA